MPSDKRQRQRENTRARQAAIAAADARARTRSRIAIGVLLVVLLGGAIAYAMTRGDNGKKVSATTTTSSLTPTTVAARAGDPDKCPPKNGTSKRFTTFAKAPKMCIDAAKSYTATVKTDVGTFAIALDAKQSPKTVNNFVFLARNRF